MDLVIGQITVDAIQFWLHFISSKESTVKCSLITSLMKSQTLAILYLESVWKMFQNLYVTVINGPKPHQCWTKPHTKKTLETFHHQFCGHNLNDPDSELGKQLSVTSTSWSVWSEQVDVQGQKQSRIFPSNSLVWFISITILSIWFVCLQTPGHLILAIDKDGEEEIYSNFRVLEQCYQLAQDGLMAYIHSTDPLLKKIAGWTNFYLPFHALASTILKAKQTILSDQNHLSTHEGLFNLVAFWSVFYGYWSYLWWPVQLVTSILGWLGVWSQLWKITVPTCIYVGTPFWK